MKQESLAFRRERFKQNCPDLRRLKLYSNKHPKTLQLIAKHLKKLEKLKIYVDRPISLKEITELAKQCPKLRYFHCIDAERTTEDAASFTQALASFSCLEDFGLKVPITPKVLRNLYHLKNLKKLDIRASSFESLTSLPGSMKFQGISTKLDLWDNHLTDEEFSKLIHAFPDIVELDIGHSSKLTDKSLFLIAEKFPNLKKLYIAYSSLFTSLGAKKILDCCSKIEKLHFRDCPKIGNGSLEYLARKEEKKS